MLGQESRQAPNAYGISIHDDNIDFDLVVTRRIGLTKQLIFEKLMLSVMRN